MYVASSSYPSIYSVVKMNKANPPPRLRGRARWGGFLSCFLLKHLNHRLIWYLQAFKLQKTRNVLLQQGTCTMRSVLLNLPVPANVWLIPVPSPRPHVLCSEDLVRYGSDNLAGGKYTCHLPISLGILFSTATLLTSTSIVAPFALLAFSTTVALAGYLYSSH